MEYNIMEHPCQIPSSWAAINRSGTFPHLLARIEVPARKIKNRKVHILGTFCLGMPPSTCRDLFSTESVLNMEYALYAK